MKLTLRQVLNSIPACNELHSIKLTPSVSMKVVKLGKELDNELDNYRTVSKGLYEHYKVPLIDTGYDISALSESKIKKLQKDLEELLDAEVELRDVRIDISEIDKPHVEISANTLRALDWVFEKEEEESEIPEAKSAGAQS
jgi:hypothetical protein